MKFFKFTLALAFLFSLTIQANNQSVDYKIKNNSPVKHYHDALSKKLTLTSDNNNYSVEIFDAEGVVIKSLELDKNSKIDISTKEMKSGNYYIRYMSNSKKGNFVKKLVIE
ncbi:T9SS type A sorting domain-containing protein [Wenyingzhuangia sp. IMCC45533]